MYHGEKINFCRDHPACSKEYVKHYSQITLDENMPDIACAYISFVCAFHTKELATELRDRAMISVPDTQSILYAMLSYPHRVVADQLDRTRI
jgi:hypothetical protein